MSQSRQLLILILSAVFLAAPAYAQPGIDEMQQARQELAADFFSVFDLSLVLAAILGICGAVRIHHNWNLGKEGLDTAVATWFFAALFMVLAGAFLKAIFGI